MLTSINGNLKGFAYNDAYIRTSSREYSCDDVTDRFVHLTNDAIQQRADDYGKYENGNKMQLRDFQKYMNQKYPNLNFDVNLHILPQMKKIIADTFKAVYG